MTASGSNEIRTVAPTERFADLARSRAGMTADDPLDFTLADAVRARTIGPRTEAQQRSLSAFSGPGGSFLVPEVLAATIIDALRPKNVLIAAGVNTIDIPSFHSTYGRIDSDATASAHAENAEITPSAPGFGKINLVPRTITALIAPVSAELMESAMNLDSILTTNLGIAFAAELDRQGLFGVGGLEMSGLATDPSIPVWNLDVNGVTTNGAPFRYYNDVLTARGKLLEANAGEPSAFISSVREEVARSKRVDGDGLPYPVPPAISGMRWLSSTRIPENLTVGSSTACSVALIGGFRTVSFGFFRQLRIKLLEERYMSQLAYGLIAYAMVDLLVEQPGQLLVIKGINGT